uniref:Hexosyltransferase n=1 Tax=Syphacia muris TaxID=451379 RepID=A0A0N5AIF4_9BILA
MLPKFTFIFIVFLIFRTNRSHILYNDDDYDVTETGIVTDTGGTAETTDADPEEQELEQELQEYNLLSDKEFLHDEFGYDDYLASPLVATHSLVPFKDVSSDSYWKTNKIKINDLRQYIEKNLTEELESLDTKPWLSVARIKEELARCIHYRYGTVSEQQFVYDKEMYGMLNIMKFSCLKNSETLYYGTTFARYRFRLKEILLQKDKSQWKRSSRDVTLRDVQKIIEHFSRNFAQKTQKRMHNDLHRLNLSTNRFIDMQNITKLLNLPSNVVEELYEVYPEEDIVGVMHQQKERTFAYVSLPIVIRVAMLSPNKIQPIMDIYHGDLSDESQITIELCAKRSCTANDQVTELQMDTPEQFAFFKDRSMRYDISDDEVLITYASSRSAFQLAKKMRKKNNRLMFDLFIVYNPN